MAPEIGLWSIPPRPDIPEELHGQRVALVAGVYIGAPAARRRCARPAANLGTPLVDMSATGTYVESQSALAAVFPDGGRYYWKSHFLDDLTDEAIAALLDRDPRRVNPESLIIVRIDASWFDPALDDAAIDWARRTWDALAPFSTGGVYLNFAGFGDDPDGLLSGRFDHLNRFKDAKMTPAISWSHEPSVPDLAPPRIGSSCERGSRAGPGEVLPRGAQR